jgi:protein-disulfide isomerase
MNNRLEGPTLALPVSEQRDHLLGPRTAPVTLVEYGDYECPYCQQVHFILQELMERMPQEVRVAFRNFPLTQVHPHARRAAEAAEAAGAQGRFWDMHDILFERQDALEDEDLVAYAQELALDLARFELELLQGVYIPRIREDFTSGVRSGVQGTPTFFINGRRHDGAWDPQSLAAAVNAASHWHVPPPTHRAGDRPQA